MRRSRLLIILAVFFGVLPAPRVVAAAGDEYWNKALTFALGTPKLRVSPSSYDFASRTVQTSSIPKVFTVKNRGSGQLTIADIRLTGADYNDFILTSQCPDKLEVDDTCQLLVLFRPIAPGLRTALLTIQHNAAGSPSSFGLSGIGMVAPAANLIANPSMELDANQDDRPDSWTSRSQIRRVSTPVHSGGFSMQHLSTDDRSYAIESQVIRDLLPGSPYAFSAWVNIPTPTTPDMNGFDFHFEVQWRTAQNDRLTTEVSRSYTGPTNGWNQVGFNLVPPEGARKAVVRMAVTSLAGTIYVDDVFFGNLIENPGFEFDGDYDGSPDSWSSFTYVTRSADVVHSGSYAMRHSASDEADYAVSATAITPLVSNMTYRFSGWVNIPETTDSFSFRLEIAWYNASGKLITTTPLSIYTADTNGAWQQTIGDVQSPSAATIGIIRMVAEDFSATIYVDDLTFRP